MVPNPDKKSCEREPDPKNPTKLVWYQTGYNNKPLQRGMCCGHMKC